MPCPLRLSSRHAGGAGRWRDAGAVRADEATLTEDAGAAAVAGLAQGRARLAGSGRGVAVRVADAVQVGLAGAVRRRDASCSGRWWRCRSRRRGRSRSSLRERTPPPARWRSRCRSRSRREQRGRRPARAHSSTAPWHAAPTGRRAVQVPSKQKAPSTQGVDVMLRQASPMAAGALPPWQVPAQQLTPQVLGIEHRPPSAHSALVTQAPPVATVPWKTSSHASGSTTSTQSVRTASRQMRALSPSYLTVPRLTASTTVSTSRLSARKSVDSQAVWLWAPPQATARAQTRRSSSDGSSSIEIPSEPQPVRAAAQATVTTQGRWAKTFWFAASKRSCVVLSWREGVMPGANAIAMPRGGAFP